MRIDILTLFPQMFEPLSQSLLGRAREKGLLEINVHNIRDYSKDRHAKCDDYIFGGGAGMLLTPQPIHDAITAVDENHEALRIYLSPKGWKFCQPLAQKLSRQKRLLLLCGHYEGIDQRVLDLDIDMELSIGDYVLTGGEIPAMAVVDALSRYVEGVLGEGASTEEESFSADMLEYPQYTRPQNFLGMEVPEVLLSGDHQKIAAWRREQALKITKENRPDLLK
jgi:tRNA (guanine37-N1)-methyltransferase